jgi:hypothetical protein
MNRSRAFVVAGTALAFTVLPGPRPALASPQGGAAAEMKKAETKEDSRPPLVIEKKGYIVAVRQPEGWQTNEEAAKKAQSSLAFSNGADSTILVRTRPKLNENVTLHLESDKLSVKQQFPRVEFGPLEVKHPSYATFPQMLFQAGELYVYLAYLNPGAYYPESVAVTLSKKKSPATPEELAAYKEVLASVQVALTEEDAQ